MTTLIILVILLVITNVGIGYWLYKTLQALIKIHEVNDIHVQWIIDLKKDVLSVYKRMKALDDKQIFQSDDEVGVVFKDMVDLISKLNERVVEDTKSDE